MTSEAGAVNFFVCRPCQCAGLDYLRFMADDDEKLRRQLSRCTPERIAFAVALGLLWLAAFTVAFSG